MSKSSLPIGMIYTEYSNILNNNLCSLTKYGFYLNIFKYINRNHNRFIISIVCSYYQIIVLFILIHHSAVPAITNIGLKGFRLQLNTIISMFATSVLISRYPNSIFCTWVVHHCNIRTLPITVYLIKYLLR